MAFNALYNQMCKGKLPVIGSWGEGTPPRRIEARRCRRLMPVATIIPRNPTTPQGVRFDLVDKSSMAMLVEHDKPVGFTGLRVRSRDLYRLWPQDGEDTQQ